MTQQVFSTRHYAATQFYLGTHQTNWLTRATVDLFVSDTRLRRLKTLPRRALLPDGRPAPWALDSGGFTQLSMHGRWTIPPGEYVRRVRRYRDEIGGLEWAAVQDWMCALRAFCLAISHKLIYTSTS